MDLNKKTPQNLIFGINQIPWQNGVHVLDTVVEHLDDHGNLSNQGIVHIDTLEKT